MKKQEVKITFTGPPGSGKTTFLRIAAKAIKEAGHEVTLSHWIDPCSMKVVLNRDALRTGAP